MADAQPNTSVRSMTHDDLETVLSWRNHPDVRRFMYTQHEISLDEHRNWFERCAQDVSRHLLIFEMEAIPTGFITFSVLAQETTADWGFYLAPEASKGCGAKLGTSALNYAFGNIGLHKVCGQALAFNERSIGFHLRLGFRQEGLLRDQHFDGNNFHDVICFGLLTSEWQLGQRDATHV